jgi:tetrahydromethanopterin S-methyltransferase subunit G
MIPTTVPKNLHGYWSRHLEESRKKGYALGYLLGLLWGLCIGVLLGILIERFGLLLR